MKKRILALLMALCLVVGVFPVSVDAEKMDTVLPASSIAFDRDYRTGYLGFSESVHVFTDEKYTMVSSNESIVSLERNNDSSDYWVSFNKVGTVILTATTESGLSANCIVDVKDMDHIMLDETVLVTVQPGDTIWLWFEYDEPGDYVLYSQNDRGHLGYVTKDTSFSNTDIGDTLSFTLTDDSTFCRVSISNLGSIEQEYTICINKAAPVESFEIGRFEYDSYSPIEGDYSDAFSFTADKAIGGDGYIGESFLLDVKVSPNYYASSNIDWHSSNESVATVNDNGWVVLIGSGCSTITATLENGISATYDVISVEKETLSPGAERTVAIQPGEHAKYFLEAPEAGQYIIYYKSDSWDNAESAVNIDLLSNDSRQEEERNGYNMLFCELIPNQDYNELNLENLIPCTESQQYYVTEPVTITLHFEKALPIESITLRDGGAIRWINCGQSIEAVVSPFLAKHEKLVFTSSDNTVLEFESSVENWSWFNCKSLGSAAVTVTSESGITATREYSVLEPFISGENSQWTRYSGENLTLEINAQIDDNLLIYAGDYWVSPKNYTVSPGSTSHSILVSLHHTYLQSLSVGTHELIIFGSGGEATTTLTILEGELTNPFTDVPSGEWYYDPVLWAVENGITNGTSDTTFSPNGSCLRSQVVTFLWRAAGCPALATADNPFVDVKPEDFYYDAVLWAVENGITNGIDATHFEPYGMCNRAQVVTFLYRAFNAPAVAPVENPFDDVPADVWYSEPVLWALEQEITNGLSPTEFYPLTICNRAQVVTFLHRAYN